MATSSQKKPARPLPDSLSDPLSFPSFKDLSNENDLDERYYCLCDYGIYKMYKHWCFLAEIVNTELSYVSMLRNRTVVRDKCGQDVPIYFYPTTGSFDFLSLQNGRTMAVLYAETHYFLDGNIGLRIENLDAIRVINCSLNELLAVSRLYSKERRVCWSCEKNAKDEGLEEFKKCSACSVASYCGKACQAKDWREKHKRICKEINKFLVLLKVNEKATIGKYLSWN